MRTGFFRTKILPFGLVIFLFLIRAGASEAQIEEPLVDVARMDSTILIDLKYAGSDNFLGIKLYPVSRCFLRKSVSERLVRVQKRLQKIGFGLKIWDAYRPLSVQKIIWERFPDSRYVSPPWKGSRHNRGAAVDLTLVDSLGNECEMPSKYDEFSRKAAPGYMGATSRAQKNREILINAMTAEGFKGISSEWWHYDAPGYRKFPILDIPLEKL